MNKLIHRSQSLIALDSLNLMLMNIHLGVRPYLVVYLASALFWDPVKIGIVMSISGIAGVIAQIPAGALIDSSTYKRFLVIAGAGLIGICSLLTIWFDDFIVVNLAQSAAMVAGALFAPAVAAISLGIVGRKRLDKQIGRNQSFTAAGNVLVAIIIGILSTLYNPRWIYYVIAFFSLLAILSTLSIRENDIDHAIARGADDSDDSTEPARIWDVIGNRNSIIFIVTIVLFHLANAAMLPMLGQLLSDQEPEKASFYLSAGIIVTQSVMVPLGIYIGKIANKTSRRSVLLIAFIVLPIRGFLYTLDNNPFYLVSIQVLDAIGAAITGIMQILIAADLTKGTGRFNLMQGVIATALGLGTALSNLLGGYLVKYMGFQYAFTTLSLLALFALAFCFFLMPETKTSEKTLKLQPNHL